MMFTKIDEQNFNNATACHICEQEFTSSDKRVRDHCHLTGLYRGSAHEKCNLSYRVPKHIPVIFHNLTGYDGHLFNIAK